MEQLLVFIETMAIDEKMTWRINGKRPGDIYEITWNRSLAPLGWGIRKGYEENWELFSNADFRIALRYAEIDLSHFERALSSTILSQAVFAGMVTDQVKAIFGAEMVERNVNESKKFLASITDLAATITGKKPNNENINQAKSSPKPSYNAKAMLLH